MSRDGPVKSTGSKAGMETQEKTLLQKNHGKERLEVNTTYLA